MRGLHRAGVIAGTIYVACRQNYCPRTDAEIAVMCGLQPAVATRGCTHVQEIIHNLERADGSVDKTVMHQPEPDLFVDRFCFRLNLPAELATVCKFVLHVASKQGIMSGSTPHSIAAGVIYYVAAACGHKCSKSAVANASGLSEATVSKCYRRLVDSGTPYIPEDVSRKFKKSSRTGGTKTSQQK